MSKNIVIILCLVLFKVNAQKKQIQVVEEKKASRISFYALNETYTDYDVKITVEGTNIRQSAAKPRFIRVPSATKVFLHSIFVTRGKTPVYNYRLVVNDSLSRRAIKRPPVSKIELPPQKIQPKKAIIVYSNDNCASCDSIISKLTADNYFFKHHNITENKEIRLQLEKILATDKASLENRTTPIINLRGKIYTWIETYKQLIEEVNK